MDQQPHYTTPIPQHAPKGDEIMQTQTLTAKENRQMTYRFALRIFSVSLFSALILSVAGTEAEAHTKCKVNLPFGGWTEGCLHTHGGKIPNPIRNITNRLKEAAYFGYRNAVTVNSNSDNRRCHAKLGHGCYYSACLTRYYDPSLVRRVTLHWGTNFPFNYSGAATFGSDIYLSDRYHEHPSTCQLLAHELVHVIQYDSYSNSKAFARDYMEGLGYSTLTQLSKGKIAVNHIHDGIPLEEEANRVEEEFEDDLFGNEVYFKNNCHREVKLALRFIEANPWDDVSSKGKWITGGWWSFSPNEAAFLVRGKNRISSNNGIFYYYAHIPGTNYSWEGQYPKKLGNRTLPMRKIELSKDSDRDYVLSIHCDNLD